jgi:hypothetical protein
MKARIAIALLLVTALSAIAYQIKTGQRSKATPSLTAYVPQDALLTIESPDFASLLKRWSNSAESKSWLATDNYAVFQNSRLFGRLGDAQTSFETAAGIPVDANLLHEVAGKESVFAWYDIGKLEFLYITHIPAQQAEKSQLLKARGSFQRRHAGNSDFYIRNSGSDYSTVAFALVPSPSGDLLLLATREDLIANALTLLAATSPANSIQQEPWFHDATAALPTEKSSPSIHMVLNLDRIVPDPHFRSYWIQRNITWMKQFRAAASDLYLESSRFREERVLLPKSPEATKSQSFDITALADLAPTTAGVMHVIATQDSSAAVVTIQQKLLGAPDSFAGESKSAPDPDLTTPSDGSAADLETRIDALPPASPTASTSELEDALRSAGLDAVLSLTTAKSPPVSGALWLPMQSAVALHTASAADPKLLASALQKLMQGTLTVSGIGVGFQSSQQQSATIYALTGARPLFFAVAPLPTEGSIILLADDQPLLMELLHRANKWPQAPLSTGVTSIATFNHATQRDPYLRVTSLIDGTNNLSHTPATQSPTAPGGSADVTSAPTFFSQNVGSLSKTFSSFQTERVIERNEQQNLHQTVTYAWGPQ